MSAITCPLQCQEPTRVVHGCTGWVGMNCGGLRCRSTGAVWLRFSGEDVPRADEVPIFWGKEKEMKAYGDAARSDEETRVGEVGCSQQTASRRGQADGSEWRARLNTEEARFVG